MEENKKKRIRTSFLIGVVVLLSLGGFLFQKFWLDKPGSWAVIQVDGEIYARLDLSEDRVMTVGERDSDYNVVEIKDGLVYVSRADCADLVCVKSGKIKNTGEVIACLPHKLIIYVEQEGSEEPVNSVAW